MTNPKHADTSRSDDLIYDLRNSKSIGPITQRAAADRIEALEAEVERLRGALQWMVDNDETNEGDEPMEEFGGQSWDEINAYWIEGLNRARAALGEKQ